MKVTARRNSSLKGGCRGMEYWSRALLLGWGKKRGRIAANGLSFFFSVRLFL